MEFHEAANIFPMDEENLPGLASDIGANGLVDDIEILDGKIIDGRRRFRACQMANVPPRFKDIRTDDPITYVLSKQNRRDLTPSQRAMIGARATALRDKLKKDAESRKHEGQKSGGRGNRKNLPENFPASFSTPSQDTRDQIGKLVGVSGKSIDHATRVIEKAIPEVVKAVDEGRMAVSTAAILATEPAEKQLEEVSNPKRKRKYKSGPGGGEAESEGLDESTTPQPRQSRAKGNGVGVECANEAVNCLRRIPKNDPLRKRGLEIVAEWLRANNVRV